MTVRTIFYRDDGTNPDNADGFFKDVIRVQREARQSADPQGGKQVLELTFDYLYVDLPAKGKGAVIDYLETRQVWRWDEDQPVYKTAGLPCVVFTADISEDETEVTITAMAACYRYPSDDEDIWWADTVLPRVQASKR